MAVRSPLKRDDMDYALSLIRRGILSIDENGHIWRHAIFHDGKVFAVPARRAEAVKSKGYLALTLQMPDGHVRSVMAHRVVWEWFNGTIPEELQINHKDLNKQNNRLDNLELMTNLENRRHSQAHGHSSPFAHLKKQDNAMWRHGETVKRLIRDEDKMQMRQLRQFGLSLREIGNLYNCTQQRVYQILKEESA